MTSARALKMGIAATALVAMAGCQAVPQQISRPAPSQAPAPQTGIEGNWIDEQGTGQTIFANGTFRTVATDTGQTLSQGNYSMRDARTIEISGQSLIREAPVRFNCQMASQAQLNCTAQSGQNFVLRRGSGMASM